MKNDIDDKKMYEAFNYVKTIESEFNNENLEEISVLEKKRIKKNLNNKIKAQKNIKRLKHGSVAAAVIFLCLAGMVTTQPIFAKNIPVLNSIIESLGSKHGDHTNYIDYTKVINDSTTSNGVTLTVNEVIADGSKVLLSYTINSDKKIDNLEKFSILHFLKVNGEDYSGGGYCVGKYVNDTTYIGREELHGDVIKNNNKLNIALNIDCIRDIKGKWNFAFSVSKNELLQKTSVIKTDKIANFGDVTLNVNKVEVSPIDTTIFSTIRYNDDQKKGSNYLTCYNTFIAFDDRGIELINKIETSNSDKPNTLSSESNFINLKRKPKYLTILPCRMYPTETESTGENEKVNITRSVKSKKVEKIINGVYPMELPQGKMGKLIITSVTIDKDKTIVKYKAEGIAPYFQAGALNIKDDKGNFVSQISYDLRENEEKPNEFTKVFKRLDFNKRHTIVTSTFDNIEVREDLKFNIELK